MVFEEARKIKNMLIRNIMFAFWKKKVPGEITDMIDLEQEVGVSDATVRAYRAAKTRKEKGEIISELYRETMRQLVEKFPALRQYFPEYDIVRYDIWSDIQDQQGYINMLWDAYRAAEAGEDWAIDLIRGEGYRTLDEFRQDIEEEERKLEEMIRELERVAPPPKPPKKKPAVEESERRVREVERELGRLRNLLETTTAEKLRFYVKARLLEKGVSVADARDITQELESDIADLAARTVRGEITQREAERRLDELIEERVRRPVVERREVIRQLESEYLAYLREQGVTNVRQVLEAVREDVEALADEVIAGRLTLDDAIQRVREIPIPPIALFRRVPTAPAPPPAMAPPPTIVKTEHDILRLLERDWSDIVTKGLRDYLSERGVTPTKRLLNRFIRACWRVLSTKEPATVREWFITYCPMARKIVEMILTLGVESREFKDWFRDVYEYFKPTIERETGIQMPAYEEFYELFKEFLV